MSLEELGITDLDLIQDDSTQPTPSFSTNSEHRTTILTKCVDVENWQDIVMYCTDQLMRIARIQYQLSVS